MPWKPAKMVRFPLKNGFQEVPKRGGHRRFINPENGRTTEVPIHPKELGRVTEKMILKEAGLEKPKN